MIKLSPPWKQWKTRLAAPAVMITARLGLACRAYMTSKAAALQWRSNSGKTLLAGLISAATAATLALASTAFAGAPAAPASRPARVLARTQAETSIPARAQAEAPVRPVREALRDALYTVDVHYVDPTTDRVSGSWWAAAVAVSTIEAYQQTTGDHRYEGDIVGPLNFLPLAHDYENNYDDDTGWWGLALLNAYSITGNTRYLDNAETIASYLYQDWDSDCGGGGIWWQRSPHRDKNAIANELFLELTAWLYHTTHIEKYLGWALAEWTWFNDQVGMISNGKTTVRIGVGNTTTTIPAYLVTDGITKSPYNQYECSDGGISGNLYTYNQGVILAGLAWLYKDTGDASYLTEAEHIANAVLNPKNTFLVKVSKRAFINTTFTLGGVLTEPTCQPGYCVGGAGGGPFKGIFVRDLRTLDDIASTTKYNQYTTMYNQFFFTQALNIELDDTLSLSLPETEPLDFLGMFWTGPISPQHNAYDSGTQVSGIAALVAALHLPGQPSSCFPNCQPGQRSSGQPGSSAAEPGSHARIFRRVGRFFPHPHHFGREDDQGQDQQGQDQ